MPDKMSSGERKGHTVKEFDRELEKLSNTVLAMGRKVGEQLGLAVKAVKERDAAAAAAARAMDDEVDDLEDRIDEDMLRLLALRNPMALDLRTVIVAGKIATDLERIGDYCANLARMTQRLASRDLDIFRSHLTLMADEVGGMLAQIMEAVAREDVELALGVWHRDKAVNTLYKEFIALLTQHICEDHKLNDSLSRLLNAARGLERMGDHITNIAEHVYFQVHGAKYREKS
ncbi:phosphate signaling complex protein PhoU [Desulfocurvibacter africanus]|uniref:phosphate signaling complex protein PhoU n=1 Tax=Desulfocurvibacter africanus TaxID=873 RepID=UPI00042A1A4A|nr:phosphate signaling complex protein PhoU [Desulfocurvibacter africanus]